MKCDFCSSPDVTWRYPCKSFDAETPPGVSFRSLAAFEVCDSCCAFIEAADWRGLEVLILRNLEGPDRLGQADLQSSTFVPRADRDYRTGHSRVRRGFPWRRCCRDRGQRQRASLAPGLDGRRRATGAQSGRAATVTAFREYLCRATEHVHAFLGNADAERVPSHLGFQVCKLHLPEINRCRRDKGLEELSEFPDSYPRGADAQ